MTIPLVKVLARVCVAVLLTSCSPTDQGLDSLRPSEASSPSPTEASVRAAEWMLVSSLEEADRRLGLFRLSASGDLSRLGVDTLATESPVYSSVSQEVFYVTGQGREASGISITDLVRQVTRTIAQEYSPSISSLTVSPDGELVSFSTYSKDNSTTEELRVVTISASSGATLWSHEGAFAPAWSPIGRQLVFVSDVNTGGRQHLFLRTEAGALVDLTPGADFDAGSPQWAPDGSRVLFVGSDPKPPFNSLYMLHMDTRQLQRLTKDIDVFPPVAVSPDSTQVAIIARYPEQTRLFLQSLITDELVPIDLTEGAALYPTWSSDGVYVALVDSHFSGDTEDVLVLVNPFTGERVELFSSEGHILFPMIVH